MNDKTEKDYENEERALLAIESIASSLEDIRERLELMANCVRSTDQAAFLRVDL